MSLAVLSGLASPADASEIERIAGDEGFDLITIDGEITEGDEEEFAKLALQSSGALVMLQSPGGTLGTALEIGKTIQIKGFSTYVPADTSCTSACALIWIAGSNRLASKSAKIGFHAGYRNSNGQVEEAGAANAVIGRYLTLLNLSQRAVVFATSAPPQGFLWLTPTNAQSADIAYKIFDLDEEAKSAEPSPAPPPIQVMAQPPTQPQAQQPQVDWYYFGDGSGSLFYARAVDIWAGASDSRSAKLWVQTDDSRNKKEARRSSMMLYSIDCVNKRYRLVEATDYFANGSNKTYDFGYDTSTHAVIPDSILESGVNLLCSDQLPAPDARDLIHSR